MEIQNLNSELINLRFRVYLYGNILAIFGVSTAATVDVPRSPRFRFVDLLLRMCCLNALPRRNFPFLVRLKRLAAPRCVLIFNFFGICSSFIVVLPRGARRRHLGFATAALRLPRED